MNEPERRIEPPDEPALVCPICFSECGKFYRHALTRVVVGCDVCLEPFDPREDKEWSK